MAGRINRATDLVSGLGGESECWKLKNAVYNEELTFIVGNSLLAIVFVSYFAHSHELTVSISSIINGSHSLPTVASRSLRIPTVSFPMMIFSLLGTTKAFQTIQFSIDNATIISSTSRWPLLSDPQFQQH